MIRQKEKAPAIAVAEAWGTTAAFGQSNSTYNRNEAHGGWQGAHPLMHLREPLPNYELYRRQINGVRRPRAICRTIGAYALHGTGVAALFAEGPL